MHSTAESSTTIAGEF